MVSSIAPKVFTASAATVARAPSTRTLLGASSSVGPRACVALGGRAHGVGLARGGRRLFGHEALLSLGRADRPRVVPAAGDDDDLFAFLNEQMAKEEADESGGSADGGVVIQDDDDDVPEPGSAMTGDELRLLVLRKWGKMYDIRIHQRRDQLNKLGLYLQIMWKFLGQKSFPLTEAQYMEQLDAVAELLTEWGVQDDVRAAIPACTKFPKLDTTGANAVMIPLSVDVED